MHSPEAMIDWLAEMKVRRQRYPPPVMSFAVLHAMLGKTTEACAIMADLSQRVLGAAWPPAVAEVSRQLGCT